MENYYVMIDGKKIYVKKEIYEEMCNVNGESRRRAYINKLAKENEISLQRLDEIGFSIEKQTLQNQKLIEDEIVNKLMIEKMKFAISTLDDDEKELIRKIFFDGLSERELAKIVGITNVAINKKLKKILSKIKFFIEN